MTVRTGTYVQRDPVEDLLAELAASDVRLKVQDGKLGYDAPRGRFTDALKQRVQALRPELLARLGEVHTAPLSSGQERMWFLNRLECRDGAGNGAYTEHLAFTLTGALDLPALEGALAALVARHTALRSLFRDGPKGPEQITLPPAPFHLEVTDLTGAPEAALEEALDRAAHRVIDLESDPHVAFRLFALAPDEHVLSVSAHHAAWDGWSNGVFAADLAAAYNALRNGNTPDLPPLERSVADVARAQRAALDGSDFVAQLDRLCRAVEGYPTTLDLPADRPRSSAVDGRGGAIPIHISPEVADALSAAGRREGATLYMTALAAWALMLARATGATRFLIGAPVAAREGAAEEALIGYLSNTVAIPVDVGAADSFGALTRQVRGSVLEAMTGQRVPFEKLVEAVAPPRARGTTPLIQTVFAMQPRPTPVPELEGLRVAILPRHNKSARYELLLNLEPALEGGLEGPLTYAAALFERATVAGWADEFQRILREAPRRWNEPLQGVSEAGGFATATERALAAIWGEFLHTAPTSRDDDFFVLGGHSLLLMELVHRVKSSGLGKLWLADALGATTVAGMAKLIDDAADSPAADVRLVTEKFNDTAAPYPRDAAMAELWQASAANHSKNTALIGRDGATMTYAELDRRAEAVSAALLASGPGETVGLAVERSFDAIAAILGIWKAGAAYLPLDSKMPAGVISKLAADSGARLFLADAKGAARLKGVAGIATLRLDQLPAGTGAARPSPRAGGDPAYVMFTSGTTGAPKGVVVPHRAIARLAFHRDPLAIDSNDIVAQAAPLAFDATVFELWPALLNGGALRIVSNEDLLDTAALAKALRETGVTVMWLTAGLFCRAADERPAMFSGLRLLVTGGETLSPAHARRVLDACPGLRLCNGYGPTENCCFTTIHPVAPEDLAGAVPIGRPLDNTRVYVVDKDLNPAATGSWGELVCAGDGLALGYAGRPDLTEASFVTLPWRKGERVYRTGDIARWRRDGALEFQGRRDGQVKIRGHRIETAAIETILCGCAGIREAAVVVTGEGANKELVACVVVTGDGSMEATWRRALAEELPVYMMPARFVVIPRLPLNANGKRDGEALRALVDGGPETDREWPLSSGQERLWLLQRLYPESGVYNVPLVFDIEGPLDTAAFGRALAALEERHDALRLRVFTGPDGRPRQRLAPARGLRLETIDLTGESDPTTAAGSRIAAELQRPFRLEEEAGARAVLCRLGETRWRAALIIHHSIVDGWSLGVIVRDLSAFYARETGHSADIPTAPEWQFTEAAQWQREFLASAEGRALVARRAALLKPLPEPLALPTDRPRPKARSFRGGNAEFTFDAARSAEIDRLAHAESTTPFVVVTALVEALLHRLTGATDIPLGTLIAGRDRAETRDTVGFLVNTLVLRQAVNPERGFRALVSETRSACLDAIADQDCPFDELVTAAGAPRDLSRNPLFDVLVVWQTDEPGAPKFPGLVTTAAPFDFPYSKFDVGFHFRRLDGRIVCLIEYSTDLFDRQSIDALFARLDALAAAALAAPDLPVGSLPALSPEERALVVERFNATAAPLETRRTIVRPLLDTLASMPATPAVLWDGAPLDYRAFTARAGAIARKLVAAGVKPGQVVGVCAPRSPEMLAAIHGILMAGAAYAPLGAGDPPARLAGMLEDLGHPVVLASAECRAQVESAAARVLDLDQTDEAEPLDLGSPDGLAYVLFTSGSTGRPKGVAIEQHSVLNRILWMQSAFQIGPGDVILQKTPVTFDVSVWELFWWSWTGAAVALPPPGAERDPLALVERMERYGVTVAHFVPSMLTAFLSCLEDGRADTGRLRKLRYVFASGEALDSALVARFNRLLHRRFGTELHNLYGPTEATVDVTWQACSPWNDSSVVPIGRPIANTRVYVLDGKGEPVGIGVPGEIHLGGPQVARGYVNRPELTVEKFIPDPFRAGERLYRTGDLGRWRRDGSVEYLGRIDHQVKVRGQRIEPGEVETALETHPGVERAVVVASAIEGVTELHAYVLGRGGIASAALRAHLRDRVTDAMVPARFFRLDSLPLTSSGKLDRKALSGAPLDATAPAGPVSLSETEAEIQAIWKTVLPNADPGPRDGFFDAGGNSLLVVMLHERLNARWPGLFSIADLFASPTIAEQARRVAPNPALLKPVVEEPQSRGGRAIAVVGMAVRLAGSEDLTSFWRDISTGADLVRPLPSAREPEVRALFAARGAEAPGEFSESAYLDDVYSFDPRRFRMSPADAALLDPEQRLFLDAAVRALDDAGRGGSALDDGRVGVFVGGSPGTTWREALLRGGDPKYLEQIFVLNVPSNIATRLSYLHNWRGPAAIFDTACSSALVAINAACEALRRGECQWALAGAAKVDLAPHGAGDLLTINSSTGRTRAFAAGADGTGSGEGAIVFVLRPLADAVQDGDPIHGVILGSAVNQDGASSGMAAPNPEAQAEVIAAAARDAGVALSSLSYIEAHGTGTALGDPIEIEGLTRAFSGETTEAGFAAIGSAKGNYGHLDSAAGALGLARALMCLAHDAAPPQPFFDAPNPRIDFDHAPVAAPRTLLAPLAPRGGPRRAGVSAFGLSGINAHLVVEAPPPAEPRPARPGWYAIGLSAPNMTLLRRYAGDVVAAMRANPETALEDIAHTFNTGRDTLAARLAVWVRDRGDLMARLAVFAAAPDAVDGLVLLGMAARGRTPVCAVHEDETGAKAAAEAFAGGAKLAWPEGRPAGRLHLPPAPLDRRHCAPPLAPAASPAPRSTSLLGPVVVTAEGRFHSLDVHDAEFWPASEHLLEGAPALVGMAFPSLLAEAFPEKKLRIRNLRWIRPLRPADLERGTVTLAISSEGAARLSGRTLDGRWQTFAKASVEAGPEADPDALDADTVAARCAASVGAPPFERRHGIVEVSKRWACLERVADGHGEALGWLRRPDRALRLHPGMLDVAAGLGLKEPGLVPSGCASIEIAGEIPANTVAHVVRRTLADGVEVELRLADRATGKIAVAFSGLRFARLAGAEPAQNCQAAPSVPVWRPEPLSARDPGGPVIVIGEGTLADKVAGYLAAAGRLAARSSSESIDSATAARIGAADSPAIVFAPASGTDAGTRASAAMRTVLRALHHPARLLGLGEGAFALDAGPLDPFQALPYGVVASATLEEPLLTARYVDTDGSTDPALLLAELAALERNPIAIAWRDGRRFRRHFEKAVAQDNGTVWPSHGCCVVTGGTGGLALLLAETLAADGRVALALLSRSGEPHGDDADAAARREKLESLRAEGLRLRTYACDVSDREALAATLERIRGELGPITAVVHNAGVPDGAYLAGGEHAADAYAAALKAKVGGACLLDELTASDPVEAFVMSASLTALTGHPGHAAYTGANAFLDAFAASRRRRGRPAVAIDWCGIREMGMAARYLASATTGDAGKDDVGPLFRRALAACDPQVALMIPEVRGVLSAQPAPRTPEPVAEPAPPRKASGGGALACALAAVWADVLGYDSVAPDADFYELGGDSLAGARIVGQVVRELGHPMTLADLFETGTVAALAERLRGRAAERRPESHGLPPAPPRDRYPVAWEQLAVLRAEQAADMGTAYNLPVGLDLPEDVDEARLRAAFDTLVARHEILRTRFHRTESGDGEPEMEILPPAGAAIEELELPSGGAPVDAMREWVRPFDLWSGQPPVRIILGRCAGRLRVVLLDVHHALADGFTMELLLSEVAALYAGTAGAASALQLKDYAWWSRRGSGAASAEESRAYWLERFRGPLPSFDLPADRPRPAAHTWQSATLEFDIPRPTLDRLRACAAERRTTPFTVVVSAWSALLARYARTDELVVAAPVDSREAASAPGLPGMLVSLVPLRLAVRKDDTVAGLIERAHSVHSEAQRHRGYGVGRLLEELAPPAAPDRALLSDISLSYMNFAEAGQVSAAGFRPFNLPRRDGKGDLAIFVRDLPGRMTMTVEYYAAIFDRDRIERMARHLGRLLEAMTASAPDRPVSSLPLVDAEESQWLAAAGEGPRPPLPLDRGLFGAFADCAAATPDAIALEGSGLRLTYRELLGRVSGIAARLRAAGVSPGDRVGLRVERDANAVVLLLGIVAAGAVYVPFDPAWPAGRSAWIRKDTACVAVIADQPGEGTLDAASLLAAAPAKPPEPPAGGAAYVMYTSGSTGAPKGAVVTQAGVLRVALGGGEIAISPQDCLLQSGPLAFDASTYEIWGALLNGARLAVATREEVLDPDTLAGTWKRYGVTVLWITTGLFNRQVDRAPESFRGLRMVLTGGEILSTSHAARALRAAPDTAFLNGYGPTENTTFTTTRRLTVADLTPGPAPIGHALAHTSVAVLEPNGAPAPIGIWGEIVTGGLGLAEGYLNQPELTAERFAAGVYRTGDLGRWRADGVLEFGGRLDGQIKLRGYRIEPEEIEQALNAHPAVAASAVLFVRDADGEASLVACLQPITEPPNAASLRDWLGRRLPAYMAPRRFVNVATMPLTANGKLDRGRMVAELPPETDVDVAGELPRPGTERLVANALAEVFARPVEDRHAGFFDLGGHSLMAIQVVNRIAQSTGVRLAMRDFFARPTVAGLAELVESGNRTGDAIERAPQAASYPASHAQARLYLASRMTGAEGAGAAYNVTFALPFGGPLDTAALGEALRCLAARHEPLRTGFHEEDGQIVQRIQAGAEPPLAIDDVSSAPDPRAESLRLARREAATPFELDRPPLVRARAIRLGQDDWLVLLVVHHIVCDGWSMNVLLRELAAFYGAARVGEGAPALDALPIAYRDFAAWQSRRDWTASADYWRSALAGAPQRIELPADRPTAAVQSHRGDTVTRVIPAELAARLSQYARRRGVTPASVGLALFASLLYRLTRQSDMVIGMGATGRDRAEVERLIGFFVNVLPIRVQLTDETEFGPLVDHAHGAILAAMDHREYPFDLLVRALAPRRVANRQPLINVVYEYHRFEGIEDDGGSATPLPSRVFGAGRVPDPAFGSALQEAILTPTAKHDLLLFFTERRRGSEFMLEYDADLLDRATAERWLAYLEQFASMAVGQTEESE